MVNMEDKNLNKKYELSLVLGRFNHIHNGHKMLIDKSIEMSKKTLILLGSAQESKTLRNPFLLETRKRLLNKIYNSDDIVVYGLDDMSHEHDISFKWGRYILDNVKKYMDRKPDVMFYGNDESRNGWFAPEDIEGIDEQIISRNIIKISATNLRGLILTNKKDEWVKYVPEEIFDEFEALREELMNVDIYKEIYEKIGNDFSLENFLNIYKEYEIKDKEDKMKK